MSASRNDFEPGSDKQNRWLSTVQPEDVVSYGATVDGYIAGANLPTSDQEFYKSTRFAVLYAVPLHILKSLVSQQVITPDVYNRTPFFRINFPVGRSNKYSNRTCRTDTETTECHQDYVTIYKHTFEYLKGTEGKKGTFPTDYEGAFYVVFVPYQAAKPMMCSSSIKRSENYDMAPGTKKREKLLGLSVNSQDVIIIILLVVVLIAVHQNQKMQDKLSRH